MFSQYLRLNLDVWATDREVITAARATILPRHRTGSAKRDARHRFYSQVLTYHAKSRAFYREVMFNEIRED